MRISYTRGLCLALAAAASFQGPAQAKNGAVISELYSSFQSMSAATKWINDTCRPDAVGDIQVVYSQQGYGTNYNFYIFCRLGRGKIGKVTSANYTYTKNNFSRSTIEKLMTDKSIVIVGLYAGSADKNSVYYLVTPKVPR